MAASIDDVAKLAGVSIATVSRSLRGLPDVAASTRDRVLAAAAQLDYVASPFAARLASGRTRTVGVVVPFVNRWYYAEVLGAIEAVLHDADMDLLLHTVGDEGRRERFFTHLPVRKRVDAVLVVSLMLDGAEKRALGALGLPVASLGVRVPGMLSVSIDDVAAAAAATTHLLDLGARRIARIGGDPDDPMGFTPHVDRRVGYEQALRAAGHEPDPALQAVGYFTTAGGEAATDAVLERVGPDGRPDAVFAESDEMAYGVIMSLRRHGLRVPGDVAVIGFDGHESAAPMDLTTVVQPVARMAADLTRRVLDASAVAPDPAASQVYDVELVRRGSTRR